MYLPQTETLKLKPESSTKNSDSDYIRAHKAHKEGVGVGTLTICVTDRMWKRKANGSVW